MGKAEGKGENWHGHVTAVTARAAFYACRGTQRLTHSLHFGSSQVAPEYRRQGLAQKLMGLLEETTIKRCVRALRLSPAS
jgi:ribosomal protein S18 acetylase RimI-like enzyme